MSDASKDIIKSNLEGVYSCISAAAAECGRDASDIRLIAVSKTKPVAMLMDAYELGIRDFGENRVQELKEKIPALPGDIRWHMIGHLQRNKVKDVVGRVYLIHSVDSIELAREISRVSVARGVTTDILLEINAAGEEAKTGIKTTEGLIDLVREVSLLPGVSVKGLMTVPPIEDREEVLRGYFRDLMELALHIREADIDGVSMDILSMGMTGDYPLAIMEGATHIRVGTGIFGQREGY